MNAIPPLSPDRPFWPFNLRAPTAAPPVALPAWLQASDLQGLVQLATQASLGLGTVAEAVHGQVYRMAAKPLGFVGARFVDPAPDATGIRPGSLTSLFYGGTRLATRLAGGTAHSLLAQVAKKSGHRVSSPAREAMLAAINAVLGDHLVDTANPLAITMALRQGGDVLPLNRDALAMRFPKAGRKLLVLVHDLGMNDLQWSAAGPDGVHDHGAMLQHEHGFTAVHVHYNSGLPPAVNGAQLAGLLELLCLAWPQRVEDIRVLAHGAGGLVARSACHQGALATHGWRSLLRQMVFLGTPHQGVPADALDSWMHRQLAANPVTWPLAQLGRLRSAGMQAVQRGEVIAVPETGSDGVTQPAGAPGLPAAAPLPLDVACFTLAAATGPRPADAPPALQLHMDDALLGDGLVPLGSALGTHADAARVLHFSPARQHVAWETHHLALLESGAVAEVLRGWLAA